MGDAPFIFPGHLRSMLPKLKGSPLAVYCALASYAGAKGECWPSVAALVAATGYDRKTVFAALLTLEYLGLIRRSSLGVRNCNRYLVIVPKTGTIDSAVVPESGTSNVPKTGTRKEINEGDQEMIEMTPRAAEPAPGSKKVVEKSSLMPLPQTVAEVVAAAQGAGYTREQASAFWAMMTAKSWLIRGRFCRDWQKALVAWCKADAGRKLGFDQIQNTDFWAFVRAGGFSEDAASEFVRLLKKSGGKLRNKLTGRLEPVADVRAAFKAFVASDLNASLESRGIRA